MRQSLLAIAILITSAQAVATSNAKPLWGRWSVQQNTSQVNGMKSITFSRGYEKEKIAFAVVCNSKMPRPLIAAAATYPLHNFGLEPVLVTYRIDQGSPESLLFDGRGDKIVIQGQEAVGFTQQLFDGKFLFIHLPMGEYKLPIDGPQQHKDSITTICDLS